MAREFTKKHQGDSRNLPVKCEKLTYAPIKEVAMNSWVPYLGVLIIRILLFRVLD